MRLPLGPAFVLGFFFTCQGVHLHFVKIAIQSGPRTTEQSALTAVMMLTIGCRK
jgi:hypothetical protein